MIAGLVIPSAFAAQGGTTIDYTVSPVSVQMTPAGTGSFTITVPGLGQAYAAVEFLVRMPEDIVYGSKDNSGPDCFNVTYSRSGDRIILPTKTSGAPTGYQDYLFSYSASQNKFTGPITCTVNVNYTGDSEKIITILQCKQSVYIGNETTPYLSTETTEVTLLPSSGGDPGSDATLSSLTLSSGQLSPEFTSNHTSYTATVPNSVTAVNVSTTSTDPDATVSVSCNGDISSDGSVSLDEGANIITVTVTAADQATTQNYTIIVTRESTDTVSHDATLKSLSLSNESQTIDFGSFSSNVFTYTAAVAYSVDSVKVTAIPTDTSGNAKVKVSPDVTPISLNVGNNNIISITVTAADGTTTNIYKITVTRASSDASHDATLKDLSLSNGSQIIDFGSFSSNIFTYTASVSNSVGSVTVSPVPTDNTSSGVTVEVKVNGTKGSNPFSMRVGLNSITILVTAADRTTTKTYTINVTRAGASSSNPGTGTETVNEQAPLMTDLFPFTDVRESDWFYGDVYYCWENKLINGTSVTTFSPDTPITRDAVVTILYREEGSPDTSSLDNPFSDVAEGMWYANAIKWASANGIVLGYPDGTYQPNRAISRQEMATILSRYNTYTGFTLPEARAFAGFNDDAAIADFAKDNVKALYMAGIINGLPDNLFGPTGTATRAQFAAMVHRLLEAVNG